MLDFAKKEQIVDVNEKSSIAESNLAAANAALGNIIAERIKNEQLWKQVEGAGEINLPQLLTNERYRTFARAAQGARSRVPGEARNLQAELPGDGADQQQDERDR